MIAMISKKRSLH